MSPPPYRFYLYLTTGALAFFGLFYIPHKQVSGCSTAVELMPGNPEVVGLISAGAGLILLMSE